MRGRRGCLAALDGDRPLVGIFGGRNRARGEGGGKPLSDANMADHAEVTPLAAPPPMPATASGGADDSTRVAADAEEVAVQPPTLVEAPVQDAGATNDGAVADEGAASDDNNELFGTTDSGRTYYCSSAKGRFVRCRITFSRAGV